MQETQLLEILDLRLLDALIKEVREGVFRPDGSRAAKGQKVDDALDDTPQIPVIPPEVLHVDSSAPIGLSEPGIGRV